jgi:hypothetical protein
LVYQQEKSALSICEKKSNISNSIIVNDSGFAVTAYGKDKFDPWIKEIWEEIRDEWRENS